MKKIINFSKRILIAGLFTVFLLSCSYTNNYYTLHAPKIQVGIAKITGKVINYPTNGFELPTLSIRVSYPVIAELKTYTTQMKADGSFSFDIPVECNVVTGVLLNGVTVGVCLVPNEETFIKFTYIDNENIKVDMDSKLGLTNEDMENLVSTALDIINYRENLNWDFFYSDVPPRLFIKKSIEALDSLQQYINHMSSLSDSAKCVMLHAYKLDLLTTFVKKIPILNQSENETGVGDYEYSYHSFFKYVDLDNPLYLYGFYHELTEKFLTNEKIIPPIGDRYIEEWIKTVKMNIAGTLSLNEGFFCDMLVANAYAKQMNDETKPLSTAQKENIEKYFKNKSFVDILLRQSDKIEKAAGIVSTLKVNEVPIIPKEELIAGQKNKQPQGKLIDAIVSNYEGKVIVIDFWATWCVPCIMAIKTSQEIKKEMLNENVVFVYITDESSPKEQWEKKIIGIGGEHYYLNKEEWESISFSDKYGFKGIPTYLIFDKNGILKHKFTSHPGNAKMQAMIEELLP